MILYLFTVTSKVYLYVYHMLYSTILFCQFATEEDCRMVVEMFDVVNVMISATV